MNTDSTVVNFGGIVIEKVTKSSDSGNGKIELIEKHGSINNPMHWMQPMLVLYGSFFVLITVIIVFLGWYYLKKKSEIAKLMIQNNMSPAHLFQLNHEKKGISNFLKFGIVFIAFGMALMVNSMLVQFGLFRYTAPVLFLFLGIALIVIHVLNVKHK